jgi:PAS domain S-box-containing protein
MDNMPVNDRASRRNRTKEEHPPKLTYQMVIVALIMLVVMTAYEWLKQAIHPNISIWESHLITILFTAFLATTVSFFVFKKLNRAYQKLLNESTERRLADQRLRESEEKHRTLFDSSRDAIMTLAPPTWLFTSGNPATVKLFKVRDEAEFISFGPWQLSPERQPDGKPSDEKAQEMIEIAMRNGSHFFEWTHCYSDGTPFPAEVLLTRMEQRDQVLLQATVRDITKRKRAEEAQKQRVKELTLLQSISQIIQKEDSCESIYQKIVYAMPKAWCYPEIACARIICEGQSYQTEHFSETDWCLSADFKVEGKSAGAVEVFYLEERPAKDEGPFIKEERDLIDLCTERLGHVTERMRAEEALRESHKRLEFALQGGELGMWDWNPQDGAVVYSDLWAQMLEYRPDEVEPTVEFFKQHVHPEDLAAVLDRLTGHVEGRLPVYESEHRLCTKSGNYFWVLDRGRIVERDKDGRPVRVTGIIADITERKQAEEALRKSEERFRNLYDDAPVGYFEYDLRGNITCVNRTELKMLGYSAEEMIGQPCWKFIVDEAAREQILAKLAGTRPPAAGLERTYRRKDGTTFPVLFEDRLLTDENAHVTGIRTAIQDITDRKQAEEQRNKLITELQKTLSEVKTLRGFLPICSHCKKIRDDKGYWNQIESYIHKHSDAEFSHGICPECAQKYYPDMDLYGDEQTKE